VDDTCKYNPFGECFSENLTETLKRNQCRCGSSPGGVLKKVLYGEAPPRGPTPYPFIYHFFRKGTPFVYLLLEKGTPSEEDLGINS